MTDTRTSHRFEVKTTSDAHFGWLRTRLSLEGTMMSSLRTAISLIGFGFAIVQFFAHLQQNPNISPANYPMAPEYLGLALIGSGVFAVVYSIWWYWRMVQYMWGEPFAIIAGVTEEGVRSPIVAIAILLVGIGLFAFFAVLFRLV